MKLSDGDNARIRELLLQLLETTISIIQKEKIRDRIEPEIQTVLRLKVSDFRYGDDGPHFSKGGTHAEKRIYYTPGGLLKKLQDTASYNQTLTFLKNVTINPGREELILKKFVHRNISIYFEKGSISEFELEKNVEILLDDLLFHGNNWYANAALIGIILRPNEFEISQGIRIRKSKKEDFEEDIHTNDTNSWSHGFPPTAFLEFSIRDLKNSTELTKIVEKTVILLRLFRVGSVGLISIDEAHPVVDLSKGIGSGRVIYPNQNRALFNTIIQNDNIEPLRKFLNILPPIVQEDFYNNESTNFISIANTHYSNSLLKDGGIEEKISGVVIGLESIFLKNINEKRKTKLLKSRVARLLVNFNFIPANVQEAIDDAYFCRTKCLHGEHLSESEKQQIKKKYNGDLKNLLFLILEFLRRSILIGIFFHPQRKEIFIEMIDNSFSDENINQELNKFLNQMNLKIANNEQTK